MKVVFTTIIIFYNGQREAQRTLQTLSAKYQNIDASLYKVIVLDSGSSQHIDEKMVKSFGEQFEYQYVAAKHPSPIEALQLGLDSCKTPYVMVCIDGARMLSPGIFQKSLDIIKINPNAFITTTGFHIGKHHQNYSILNGYNQEVEDKLLEKVNWQSNGYALFKISSLYQDGYSFFSHLAESNCFMVKTSHMRDISFHQGFISKGGGLINLSVFKDLIEIKQLQVYALIGEATFHQFHGGAASNISMAEHPVQEYRKEYKSIMGKEFSVPKYNPIYYGDINNDLIELRPKYDAFHILKTCNYLIANNKPSLAIDILKEAIIDYPYHSSFLIKLNRILMRQGRLEEGLQFINAAIELTPHHPFLYLHRAKYNFKLEKWDNYKADILESLNKYNGNIGALIEIYNNHKLFNYSENEAENLLIENAGQISKISHLKKILTILLKREELQQASDLIANSKSIFVNSLDISFIRLNIAKKLKNEDEVNEVLDLLYDQVITNSKLPIKQKLRSCQIFINHKRFKFAAIILDDDTTNEDLRSNISVVINKNQNVGKRLESLTAILPTLNTKKAKAFLEYYNS